jgi:hypothetical protein
LRIFNSQFLIFNSLTHLFITFKKLKNMEKFLLLFRWSAASEGEFQALSPEAMQAEIARWGQWIGGIAAQGKLISTEALCPTGRSMAQKGSVVTDGPYTESKELINGFMLVSVANYEEAVEIGKGCPSLHDGGTVEVRQIQNFG